MNRSGFSLLEAVVAVTIVGTVAVGVLAAFGAELRSADRAKFALEAEALAQDRLAMIRLLPARSLSPLADSMAHGTFGPPLDAFNWDAEVRLISQAGDLTRVWITVHWPQGYYRVGTTVFRRPTIVAGAP